MEGGAGSDAIFGNAGDDTLIGGQSADGFYFQSGDGDDVVQDFDLALDKLVFIGAGLSQITDLQFSETAQGDALITYGASSIVLDVDGNDSLFLWY